MYRKRLKQLMKEQHLNRTSFADKLGISRQSMGFYLSGERIPKVDIFEKMARTLNVSADYLLGLTDLRTVDRNFQAAIQALNISEKAGKTILYFCCAGEAEKEALERLLDIDVLNVPIYDLIKMIECYKVFCRPSTNTPENIPEPNPEHITPFGEGILFSSGEAIMHYAREATNGIYERLMMTNKMPDLDDMDLVDNNDTESEKQN